MNVARPVIPGPPWALPSTRSGVHACGAAVNNPETPADAPGKAVP